MHGGVSAPSCCAFIHSVAFEEVSGYRGLIKSIPEKWGLTSYRNTHEATSRIPRETCVILHCAWKVENPLQTKQGNRPSCRDREGIWGSDEVVAGTSVFLSNDTGMSENFWGRIRVPSTVSHFKTERGTSLETL